MPRSTLRCTLAFVLAYASAADVPKGTPEVTANEPKSWKNSRAIWESLDKDKDGKMTGEELGGYFYKEFYGEGGVLTTEVEDTDKARSAEDGVGLFKELDLDNNKELSFEEFAKHFNKETHPDEDERSSSCGKAATRRDRSRSTSTFTRQATECSYGRRRRRLPPASPEACGPQPA